MLISAAVPFCLLLKGVELLILRPTRHTSALLFHRVVSVSDGKITECFYDNRILWACPAPPSFRHARPRVRRPSGLDSSVLGPPTLLYLTYFGKALGRRKGGTFTLAVCEKKHAEIDGILVGKGNIFLGGSTSAALGKCSVTLFWVKSHYRKRRHTKKKQCLD